jgi:hypothetical protein
MRTANPFAAYIISFFPENLKFRKERRDDLVTVLDWWMTNTFVPLTLITSNWLQSDFRILGLSIDLSKLVIIDQPGQPIALNRIAALGRFYSSEHDWGIMLDDDAMLYDGPQHNRGPHLFSEMISNGIAAYDGVDVFFPINPQKVGFSPIYAANPALYKAHHVFERNIDLKGSLFVVRNFKKEGKPIVELDPNFTLLGEDRQFALQAVQMGYSVMRCENIVLRELSGSSHFDANRTTQMKIGYTRLAHMYASCGLAMKPNTHQHDLTQFWENCWGNKPKRIVV